MGQHSHAVDETLLAIVSDDNYCMCVRLSGEGHWGMPTIHIPTWLKQLSGQLGLYTALIKPTIARPKQVGSNLTCYFAAIDEVPCPE